MRKWGLLILLVVIFYFVVIYSNRDKVKKNPFFQRFKWFIDIAAWVLLIAYGIALITLVFS